jgi:predicted MFS family arabinose efflux permease
MESVIQAKAKPIKEPVPKGAWGVLFAVWIVSIAAPLNMFKPATIAPELIQSLGIITSSYGWIMSVFSIMGLILALPATGIVYRLGLRNSFIISLGTLLLGTVMGAFAPSFEILLLSRIIEGCGMGFIGVAAPTALSLWFPLSRQGLPMAIFQTWMPFGTLITMNMAPVLASAASWRMVWWFAAGYCVVAFIILFIFFKDPSKDAIAHLAANASAGSSKVKKTDALKNPSLWVLCIAFMVFALCCTGTTSAFWSLYMREAAGINASTAAAIVSLCTVLGIVGNPFGGWLSDKLRTRKWLMMASWVIVIVFLWFAFSVTDIRILVFLAIMTGICQGWVPVTTTVAIPEILNNPEHNAMGMGLMNVFRNFGNILGGMALGYAIVPFGWSLGSHILLIPPIIVVFALILIVTRKTLR